MANKILSFYARLPEGIDRPFTNDFFGAVSRAELMAVLERTEQTEELLQKMDAALAALSLDFEAYGTNYQQKTELLSELHQKEPIRYFRHRKQNRLLWNHPGTR